MEILEISSTRIKKSGRRFCTMRKRHAYLKSMRECSALQGRAGRAQVIEARRYYLVEAISCFGDQKTWIYELNDFAIRILF